MQDITDNMFEIRVKGGISVIQINRFLGEADDVDAMAPVNLNNLSTLRIMNKTERIDELDWSEEEECIDDVILCGICSDEKNATLEDSTQKVSVDDVIERISTLKLQDRSTESDNSFESILLGSDLLHLARRMFYEGQVRRNYTQFNY